MDGLNIALAEAVTTDDGDQHEITLFCELPDKVRILPHHIEEKLIQKGFDRDRFRVVPIYQRGKYFQNHLLGQGRRGLAQRARLPGVDERTRRTGGIWTNSTWTASSSRPTRSSGSSGTNSPRECADDRDPAPR